MNLDRSVIFVLRILIGWTFLYAGFWQIRDNYDTAGFLNHVVTFHDFFSLFAKPAVLPYTDFLVKWGHLLIGTIAGLGAFGAPQRAVWHPADDHLLLRTHGVSINRESFQLSDRLSPRLCDRARPPHRPSRGSRMGSRRSCRTIAHI